MEPGMADHRAAAPTGGGSVGQGGVRRGRLGRGAGGGVGGDGLAAPAYADFIEGPCGGGEGGAAVAGAEAQLPELAPCGEVGSAGGEGKTCGFGGGSREGRVDPEGGAFVVVVGVLFPADEEESGLGGGLVGVGNAAEVAKGAAVPDLPDLRSELAPHADGEDFIGHAVNVGRLDGVVDCTETKVEKTFMGAGGLEGEEGNPEVVLGAVGEEQGGDMADVFPLVRAVKVGGPAAGGEDIALGSV